MKPITVPDYHLVAKCGRGAYGDVYVAKSLSGSLVALKVIEKNTHSAKEFNGLKYYCSRCTNSPYLIKIFHTGETESFFYYTMELADNYGDENNYIPATLANYLVDHKRLPLPQVMELALNLLSGLETLHNAGLVHRDIKPENIIFVNKIPKLSDIGLVSSISAAFSLGGTLGFIPPEKLKSSSGSKSATDDLYALGKLIYCVFTGNSPDRFPSIPQDIVLDEDAKRLNEVILIACSKVNHLRFHSIDKFRKALTSSISGKRKVLNCIWGLRYFLLTGIMLYLAMIVALPHITSSLGLDTEDNRYEMPMHYKSASVNSGKNRDSSLSSRGTSNDSKSGRNGAGQKNSTETIIPQTISDSEFKNLLTQQFDNYTLMTHASKVEYYLLEKGSKRFPELKKEFSNYLANLTAIEQLMIMHIPDKVAEIRTAARNCTDAIIVPHALVFFLSPDMWNSKKMHRLYCNCAISAENIAVIFMEKRHLLPEALEWDKFVIATKQRNSKVAKPIYFTNVLGGIETDWEHVLESYKNALPNPAPERREYNQQLAVRFLGSLKSCISTPEIAALEVEMPPLEIRLATAKAIRSFAQENINDYVVYKYGINIWELGDLYVKNYLDVRRKVRDGINNLPAVQQQRKWAKDKLNKINEMREKEMRLNPSPQVAAYLKAKRTLEPYLDGHSPEKPIAKSE